MATISVKELFEFDCCTVVGEEDGTYSVADIGLEIVVTIIAKELFEFDCCTVVGEEDGTYSVADIGLEIFEDDDDEKYVIVDKSPEDIEL